MSDKANILFVDDERQILIALRALFRSQYQVFTADGGDAALDIIRREHVHAIISDQRMPKMLGHELLREVKTISPSTMRLLLTGYSDLNAIINSVNEGEVFRFINKPWNNDEIRTIVDIAVQIARDTKDEASDLVHEAPDDELANVYGAGILIIDDDPRIVSQVKRLFQHERPVHSPPSIDAALDILVREEIGVIITDVTVNGEDTTEFIKLLKQQYALIMTIVLTEIIDSEVAIALINQARVYRYLRKPIGDGLLYPSINNGIRFYQINKETPKLLQQQKVESIKVVNNPSLAERLVGRLKSLRRHLRLGL